MIEAGVPLFDWLESRDTIWVYYPLERVERVSWRCDLMTLHNGDVFDCRGGLYFSERFLFSLFENPPK